MTPVTDSQVGPPGYHSHSEQQQTVTSQRAAHSKMVASQLDDATSSPQGRTEQHLEQTAKRAHTVASLQYDGQLRSPDNIREEHGTDELTDVSRSLFGISPSRSQLDAFFRQEKQQVSMNQQMSLTRCLYTVQSQTDGCTKIISDCSRLIEAFASAHPSHSFLQLCLRRLQTPP